MIATVEPAIAFFPEEVVERHPVEDIRVRWIAAMLTISPWPAVLV
jgi:hypothetical protein